MEPITVPWSLTEIKGGSLNAEKLCQHIISIIKSIHPIRENASTVIMQQMRDNPSIPIPPSYFQICEVLNFSNDEKSIIQLIMQHWPVAADDCSTTMSAGNMLVEKIGLPTPFIR